MKITFEEVVVRGSRVEVAADGRRRRKTKRFWQTLNPFNIDPLTGAPKTREKIYSELKQEAYRWENFLPEQPPEVP